jgi:polar amino acid transport system permease protein
MATYATLKDWLNLLSQFGTGTLLALAVFVLTLLFSLPLGLAVSFGRMSRKPWIWQPVNLYILIMRGTPLILQLIFFYFIIPRILPFRIDRFPSAIIAFVLNYAAYFAEIYRGGIQSIPAGQYEAAQVLGLTRRQTFFRIILPQVVKRVLLPVSNEVITLVKDTALVSVLGISELFRLARDESSRAASVAPLFVAGLIYFVLNGAVSRLFMWFEKKLDYYQ